MRITRSKSGLNMAYWNLPVKGRQSTTECCRGIALHHNQVRVFRREHWFQTGQDARRRLEKRLVRPHEVQVVIRCDLKRPKHLVQQRPVLRRHTDPRLEPNTLPHQPDQRTQLDRLRPGAKHEQDFDHLSKSVTTVLRCLTVDSPISTL